MSYNVIALANIVELKTRRGPDTTDTTIATILGPDWPITEAYSVYVWDHASTATESLPDIVTPTLGTLGRWFKDDLNQVPQINSDWNAISGIAQVLNKPALSIVAISGNYNDLLSKPTIPAAQVNANWTAVSGVSQVLNKPTIPAAQVNCDWNATSGITQLLNKPTLKRVETYLGTSDASGNYTVTYSTAYATTPDVQPQLQAGTPSQVVRITSSTTTGFIVNVTNRASVSLLGLDLLLSATTPVSGASVSVLVTSR